MPSNRRSSPYEIYRHNYDNASPEIRAFWQWATVPSPEGADARELIGETELRVLSKAASAGGFFVPTDVSEMVIAAARASSAIAQVSAEIVTDSGATIGMALTGTHGTAAWVAESGSYTASDETVTQQNMGAFKGGNEDHRLRGAPQRRSRRARQLPRLRAGRKARCARGRSTAPACTVRLTRGRDIAAPCGQLAATR